MVERKRVDGPGGADYVGLARNLLAQLKQSMRLNDLKVLTRTVDVGAGVRIIVGSVFGQDTIVVQAPPAVEEMIAAQIALEQAVQNTLPEDRREVPIELVKLQFADVVRIVENVSVRFTDAGAGTPTLRVYIAGRRNGRAIVYANGSFYTLGQRASNERNGRVYAFSADGTIAIGSVEAFIPAVNGWQQRAAVWSNGFETAPNVILHSTPANNRWSYAFERSGSTYYVEMEEFGGDGRMAVQWNGTNGAAGVLGPDRPANPMTTTSRDGRVTASGNTYRIDGGESREWVGAGGVADCVHTVLVASTGRDFMANFR